MQSTWTQSEKNTICDSHVWISTCVSVNALTYFLLKEFYQGKFKTGSFALNGWTFPSYRTGRQMNVRELQKRWIQRVARKSIFGPSVEEVTIETVGFLNPHLPLYFSIFSATKRASHAVGVGWGGYCFWHLGHIPGKNFFLGGGEAPIELYGRRLYSALGRKRRGGNLYWEKGIVGLLSILQYFFWQAEIQQVKHEAEGVMEMASVQIADKCTRDVLGQTHMSSEIEIPLYWIGEGIGKVG